MREGFYSEKQISNLEAEPGGAVVKHGGLWSR
jgi:hypothetical protein